MTIAVDLDVKQQNKQTKTTLLEILGRSSCVSDFEYSLHPHWPFVLSQDILVESVIKCQIKQKQALISH